MVCASIHMKAEDRPDEREAAERRRRTAVAACVVVLLQAPLVGAQIDLSGTYVSLSDQDVQIETAGPNYADYTGIPLNDQARAAALSYTPETISEIDRQCQPYKINYLPLSLWGFRMWPTVDVNTGTVVAWNITGTIDREPTTIWMDGRLPPAAVSLATPGGFTTGAWQGHTLVAVTTNLQDGYLTRNGVPSSDQEVFTMFLMRESDLLTVTGVIRDPVYLTAPYVLANVWRTVPDQPIEGTAGAATPATCTPAEEVPSVLNGHVPSYLTPADNPNLLSISKLYRIPQEATLGDAQTMYPEYAEHIAPKYRPPTGYCTQYCCGSNFIETSPRYNAQVLHCPAR